MKRIISAILLVIIACTTVSCAPAGPQPELIPFVDQLTAEELVVRIDNLGEITADSENELHSLYNYYLNLSSEDKKKVTNYDKFAEAVAQFSEIPDTKDITVKVMSYNLKETKIYSEERRERIDTVIKQFDADLIGLQESDGKWIPYIREELSDKYYFLTFTPDVPGLEHEARDILVKKSVFDIVEFQQHAYTFTSDDKLAKEYDGTVDNATRILISVLVERKSDGQRILFVNTHFTAKSDFVQNQQSILSVKMINDYIRNGIPVLWTGDFNAKIDSVTIQNILDAGYEPTCYYGERETTYHGWNYDENFFSEIDFIFVRDNSVIVKDYEVFNEMVNGDYASDHHPVISNVYVP
ncbi:MAG: hypothetical protein E7481_08540 [Ruminococcaceae bacterium]|nr:hypothetical protein [Oscillospiraceae bacterium]